MPYVLPRRRAIAKAPSGGFLDQWESLAEQAYGMERMFSSTSSTANTYRVKRASDDATANYTPSTTISTIETFLGGSQGEIVYWYGQGGGPDYTPPAGQDYFISDASGKVYTDQAGRIVFSKDTMGDDFLAGLAFTTGYSIFHWWSANIPVNNDGSRFNHMEMNGSSTWRCRVQSRDTSNFALRSSGTTTNFARVTINTDCCTFLCTNNSQSLGGVRYGSTTNSATNVGDFFQGSPTQSWPFGRRTGRSGDSRAFVVFDTSLHADVTAIVDALA